MKIAATIALFCAGGGLTRYYLSGWVYGLLGRAFPYPLQSQPKEAVSN